ncbi:hypothetical protein [Nitratiruptor sp. YY09-18]|uniref:hypothetical protein n=1 Tax=Nitratiruptor sp. YY09-18 TaxID=2724901 RepID=UPI00191580D1|nr:hypothetical protein [Nitratiruptor sp. YY09-18]BCD67972.1 cell division transport system permease protein [Nitratiruptor sp. YY09-18]
MKSLKNHISLIIPLFAILFAVEFYFIVDKAIKSYEKNLNRDYSIVVVAKKPLTLAELKAYEPSIKDIKPIDPSLVINRLKQSGVNVDTKELKNFLPFFYKVYLTSFPDPDQINSIKQKLLKFEGISRVEVFLKIHEKIYHFLIFLRGVSTIFLMIIFITSIMLVFKQIELWHLEHKERMYIMALFGAPLWMRTAVLVKLSIIDTIISALLVYVIYLYFLSTGYIQKLLGLESIDISANDIFMDLVWLFGLGVLISFINILVVSLRQPKI